MSRKGLGCTRHVQTRYLWVQQGLRNKLFELLAVSTDKNVSDVCTKPVPRELCLRHMESLGQRYAEGKSVAAKAVQ